MCSSIKHYRPGVFHLMITFAPASIQNIITLITRIVQRVCQRQISHTASSRLDEEKLVNLSVFHQALYSTDSLQTQAKC